MDDPALTALVLLALLAAPSAEGVADRWAVPPVLASHTRLPVPAGQSVRWTATGLTILDGMVVNDGLAPKRPTARACRTLPGGIARVR